MNFHTVFTDSNVHAISPDYRTCLRETALELNVREDQLILEPDPVDGNQYEEVFLYASDAAVATIYNDEQYARIRS